MLPVENRFTLREHLDFFRHARRVYTPLFVLFWQKSTQTPFQATVIVAKKVSPKASGRNLLKRRVREALQKYIRQEISAQVVVSLHPLSQQASFRDIEKEMENAINRMKKELRV